MCCNYTQDSDIQNASQDFYCFSHTNGQEFAYRYAQYNPFSACLPIIDRSHRQGLG